MKNSFFILLILFLTGCGTTEKVHTAQYNGKDILVGKGHRSDLEKKYYNEWFDANYRDYRPDAKIINQLKPVVNAYKIVILMGTWCPDSREQVPVLFKVLDEAGYRKTPDIFFTPRKYKYYKPAKNYKIIRVPTIIVYKDDKEKARIIEYPMKSIEVDLLKIMTTNDYLHELQDYSGN